MIFLVQSSLSHSMVLFFSSLSLFVGWLSEGKKIHKAAFKYWRHKTRMNTKDGKVTEGGLNVTLTIRLLMHGKVKHLLLPQQLPVCWASVCSYHLSLAVTLTEGLLLLFQFESKAPLPWLKNQPLPFKASYFSLHYSPSSLELGLACTKPILNSSGGKMSYLIDS